MESVHLRISTIIVAGRLGFEKWRSLSFKFSVLPPSCVPPTLPTHKESVDWCPGPFRGFDWCPLSLGQSPDYVLSHGA